MKTARFLIFALLYLIGSACGDAYAQKLPRPILLPHSGEESQVDHPDFPSHPYAAPRTPRRATARKSAVPSTPRRDEGKEERQNAYLVVNVDPYEVPCFPGEGRPLNPELFIELTQMFVPVANELIEGEIERDVRTGISSIEAERQFRGLLRQPFSRRASMFADPVTLEPSPTISLHPIVVGIPDNRFEEIPVNGNLTTAGKHGVDNRTVVARYLSILFAANVRGGAQFATRQWNLRRYFARWSKRERDTLVENLRDLVADHSFEDGSMNPVVLSLEILISCIEGKINRIATKGGIRSTPYTASKKLGHGLYLIVPDGVDFTLPMGERFNLEKQPLSADLLDQIIRGSFVPIASRALSGEGTPLVYVGRANDISNRGVGHDESYRKRPGTATYRALLDYDPEGVHKQQFFIANAMAEPPGTKLYSDLGVLEDVAIFIIARSLGKGCLNSRMERSDFIKWLQVIEYEELGIVQRALSYAVHKLEERQRADGAGLLLDICNDIIAQRRSAKSGDAKVEENEDEESKVEPIFSMPTPHQMRNLQAIVNRVTFARQSLPLAECASVVAPCPEPEEDENLGVDLSYMSKPQHEYRSPKRRRIHSDREASTKRRRQGVLRGGAGVRRSQPRVVPPLLLLRAQLSPLERVIQTVDACDDEGAVDVVGF